MRALYDVPAPAKLNLFLHVTGQRPDGYHLLQSVFMLIDWHDTLHFELRSAGEITREDLGPRLAPDDLVLQAARALKAEGALALGAHIGVHKRIPSQAGMGGGSSDAASCLLALNRLWALNLPLSRLEKLGLALGADIPFFLRGRNAWVEGIGEQITPVTLPHARFAVARPQQGLETRLIFSDAGLERATAPAIISGFAADPWRFGRNDLQPVAQRLCPEVTAALGWLGSLGLEGRMTGSGSAVFALLPPGLDLPSGPPLWQVRECSNMEVHPLTGWASSDD